MRFFVLLCLLIFPALIHAEIITYEKTVKKIIGTSQSIDDAKVLAVADAKRDIIEQAGTYIQSITVVENGELKKDEVNAIAMGILNTEVTQMQNIIEGDSFGIVVTVKADVDTSTLQDEIKRIREDERLMDSYRELEKRLNEQLARNAELDSKVAVLEEKLKTATEIEKKEIVEERKVISEQYDNIAKEIAVDELYGKAARVFLSNPSLAITYLTQVIEIDPANIDVYELRAGAYQWDKQYELAIKDFNIAIKLNPNSADNYHSLGSAYSALYQYDLAIIYFTKAIEINSNNAMYYASRASAYSSMDNINSAIRDISEAIALQPNESIYYTQRGYLYEKNKQHTFSILDFTKAIQITPYDDGVYVDRGMAYGGNRLYKRALNDYTTAININPKNDLAYQMRGVTYFREGEIGLACQDLTKACQLGNCDTLKHMQEMGYCK